MKPAGQSSATSLLAAILGVAAAALPVRAVAADAESFQYAVENLPQNSDPRWELLGDAAVEAGVLEGVLQVESTSPYWMTWRLGRTTDGHREFGDVSAMPIERGGAVTVDFRVRVPNQSLPSEIPCLYILLANGSTTIAVTFSAGEVRMDGQPPMVVDTSEWGDYRMVIDGMRIALYCAKSGQSRQAENEVESDYGLGFGFGIPAWEDALEPRGFELQALRWLPNQALFEPPEMRDP